MKAQESLVQRFKDELGGQIFATVASAVLTFGLARLLNPDEYGLLFLSISVFSVVKVFSNLGIPKSTARYLTEFSVKNPSKISRIIDYSLIINLSTMSFVLFIIYTFRKYTINLIGEPELEGLFVVGVFYVASSSLVFYTRIVSQGLEDISLSASINVLKRVFQMLFALAFVYFGYDVVGALWGMTLGFMISGLFGLSMIFKRYHKFDLDFSYNNFTIVKKIIAYSIPLTITNSAGKLDQQVDIILIGYFLNPMSVGFYALSKQIIDVCQLPASSLGFSISPTYGKRKAENNLESAARIFHISFENTLLLYIPAAAGIWIVSPLAIKHIFGSDFLGAVPVLRILSIHVILRALTKITDSPLDYLGLAKNRAIAKTISSLSNFLLNILLIPMFGVEGAAISTVITHSFYVSVKLFMINNELNINARRIVERSLKILISTIIMGGFVYIVSRSMTGITGLIISIASGLVIYVLACMSLGIIDQQLIKKIVS